VQLRGGEFQLLEGLADESALLAGLHEDDDLVTWVLLQDAE
jgi:hypothetical protein